jgi:hypothetical protein
MLFWARIRMIVRRFGLWDNWLGRFVMSAKDVNNFLQLMKVRLRFDCSQALLEVSEINFMCMRAHKESLDWATFTRYSGTDG